MASRPQSKDALAAGVIGQAPFDCAHRRLRADALRSGCLLLLYTIATPTI
jgi:hypothetical protein